MNRAQIGVGALGAVLAFAVTGPVGAIIVAWLLISPDAAASTARGGGAGAIGAAAKAAGTYLADEWRAGGPARQQRRTARRQRWSEAGGWRARLLAGEHVLVLIGRGLKSVAVAAAVAAVIIPAGARAGAQTARREYRDRKGHPTDTPRTSDADPTHGEDPGATDGEESGGPSPSRIVHHDGEIPTTGAQPDVPAGDSGTPDSGGRPATGQAPPQPTGDGMTQTDTTTHAGGAELTNTGDLRAEVIAMQTLIEEAEILGRLMQEWQAGLSDAYESGNAAGGPKTKALDEAVAAVVEAGPDGSAFGEALSEIRLACDQADSLGEHASSMGADGHTKGFASA